MQPNNIISIIQQQIGITKKDIADYLNVSKSFIGMVEQGKKFLSTENLLKLTHLHQLSLQNNLANTNAEMLDQENDLSIFLQKTEIINLSKKKHLEQQLMQLQNEFNNALKSLQVIRMLQNSLPNTLQNKKDILWCAAMEATAIDNIKKNGLVQQKKLEIKINNLQYP